MPDPKGPPPLTGGAAEQQMRRLTRRGFITGGTAALTGLGAWRWLTTASPEDGVPWPLRRVLRFNERLAEVLGSPHGLAPTFPTEGLRGPARANGLIGLDGDADAVEWQLRIEHESGGRRQTIRLRDLRALPRLDQGSELKCVEGWSEVMHFGGVRFRDFVTRFGLATHSGRAPDPAGNPQDLYRYVYLATPDDSYYVGLDMASALLPQTMLCDTMNWQPLTRAHGAPVRLYLPVKYGYKSLKRVGLVRFQDERPSDYWGGRGYDWYGGL
jgi:hypothetical protein